jgi:hypothetical protein
MRAALRALAAAFDLVARVPSPPPRGNIVHLRHQQVVDAVVHAERVDDDGADLPRTEYRHDAISEACDRLFDP